MKNFLLLLASIVFIETAYAQQPPQAEQPTKEYYLKKWRRQRTAGIIMVSGGGVLTAFSVVGFIGHSFNTGTKLAGEILGGGKTTDKAEKPNVSIYLAGCAVGIAAMAGSVLLFISSKKNRKKAETISASFIIKPEYNSLGRVVNQSPLYSAVGLQIKF